MTQLYIDENTMDFPAVIEPMVVEARPSRLLSRAYRDIGLAVVAAALDISGDDLDDDLLEAVRRGAGHIFAMPAEHHLN